MPTEFQQAVSDIQTKINEGLQALGKPAIGVDGALGKETTKGLKTLLESEDPAARNAALEILRNTDPNWMIAQTMIREGGFVNDPNDKGGATKFGITQGTLQAWRRERAGNDTLTVSGVDVQNLTQEEAAQIYKRNYLERTDIEDLPAALQPVMFDAAVLHGPAAASKMLQQELLARGHAIGTADGDIGSKTIEAAKEELGKDPHSLIGAIVDRRVQACEGICERNPSQAGFLTGWKKRIEAFRPASAEGHSYAERQTDIGIALGRLGSFYRGDAGEIAASSVRRPAGAIEIT